MRAICGIPVAMIAICTMQGIAAEDTPTRAPSSSEMATLVDQLGDRSFQKREKAAQALLALGRGAEEALVEGARSEDLEVRRRCRELLGKIRYSALQRTIDRFIADTDGKEKIDLAGWEQYRKLVGGDKQARHFFVDMLKLDRELMLAMKGKPSEISDKLTARTEAIYKVLYPQGGFIGGKRPTLNPTEVAILMLMSSYPDVRLPRQQVYRFTNFFYQSSIRNALSKGKEEPFRRLFVAWMKSLQDETLMGQMLQQASNLKIEELDEIAIQVVKNEKINPRWKAHAFTLLAKKGNRKHVPLLEKYLDQKQVICSFGMGNGLQGKTEVRDVALAMLLVLTNQDHGAYNFTYTRNPNGHDHYRFNASFLGFSNDADRSDAIEKWKTWKKKRSKS